MNRTEALESIRENVESEKMVRHMLATEAVLGALAHRLGEDEMEWGLTGLVHDIDIELIDGDMYIHGKLGADLVREMGANETMAHAVLCHNPRYKITRETRLDTALICADALPKIIMATAQAHPDKKLALVNTGMIEETFRDEKLAPEADRGRIALCADLGLSREEFIELGLVALQKIAPSLGLEGVS